MIGEVCRVCERTLDGGDIGITKKLVSRGATEFYCVDCLAARFRVTPEDIREKSADLRSRAVRCFLEREKAS